MKILITGITGLLGSYLAKEFVTMGELHGLSRKGSAQHLLKDISHLIHWHEGDINDYQSLEDAFEGMDLIVHAAGLVSYDPKDKGKLIEVNVGGTANVVNVMLQKGIKDLLHISSVAALGRVPGISVVDENHKWVTSSLNSPYGISKYLGELEVWRGIQEGLRAMIFNPSVLLGRMEDRRSSTAIYDYVLQGNKFYPLGSVNYLDIRDACKMILLLYQKDRWNERFILNRESIAYKDFFGLMASAFDKPPPNKALPSILVDLAVISSRVLNTFNRSFMPLNRQIAHNAQQRITFDNKKVRKLLDFEFIPLESTFAWAVGNSI